MKDEGIGMLEYEQKNLFDGFYRAKSTINIQGTGLVFTVTFPDNEVK